MNDHPWHPVFVHFPIACWVMATTIDLVGQLVSIPQIPGAQWASISHLLLWGGISLAGPAMVAGFFDYARWPSQVQESAELFWHIVSMTSAWALFLGTAMWRASLHSFTNAPSWGMTLLELVATGVLVAGGRFASTVVFSRIPAAIHSSLVPDAGRAETGNLD